MKVGELGNWMVLSPKCLASSVKVNTLKGFWIVQTPRMLSIARHPNLHYEDLENCNSKGSF